MRRGFAVIFDMNGVIVDDSAFHKRAWKAFCESHGFPLTEEQLARNVYGKRNKETLEWLFKKKLPAREVARYAAEKEALYRKLYRGSIAPVKGLRRFLAHLRREGVILALATSAPPKNVKFILAATGLRGHFRTIVDDTDVRQGKPHPEIYLKTAARLRVKPSSCIVFEDSLSGIASAKSAGMRVVAITTTHARKELARADLVIDDFSRLRLDSPVFRVE